MNQFLNQTHCAKKFGLIKSFYCLGILLGLICLTTNVYAQTATKKRPPNVIIILADDLGYGDLSCFGSPGIRTPSLDQMALEGIRFTEFYVGTSICTPSRAALLTGRLPVRTGMNSSDDGGNVLYPGSAGGLQPSEITIASALKTVNYATGLIGKWHLGDQPKYMPNSHGFDYYFGLPYSNDMSAGLNKKYPPLPVYRNTTVIETEPDQTQLTKRYTAEAIGFIKRNKNKPFFLYYASNAPHTPLSASADFKGKSKRGLYGDVVEELDWSVGKVLATLKELKLDKNTLVIFTSDNGPWLIREERGGSAGLLSGGKGSPYEGGYRVPAIAWWPGTIKANQISESVVRTMDLFPTILNLAKAKIPTDRIIDGTDVSALLTGKKQDNNGIIYYYTRTKLCAIRKGNWKALFVSDEVYFNKPVVAHNPAWLYNVETDPSEKFEVGKKYPEVLADMQKEYDKQIATVIPATQQLDKSLLKK